MVVVEQVDWLYARLEIGVDKAMPCQAHRSGQSAPGIRIANLNKHEPLSQFFFFFVSSSSLLASHRSARHASLDR